MKAVIVGCGRLGSSLAMSLAQDGHQVTIIDREARSFQRRLDPEFPGTKILGDAMDEDVLIRAGVQQADLLVTLTNGDNRNIMIAQIAREKFHVPMILARIVDPLRAAAFRELGVATIDQTRIMTDYMRRAIFGEAPNAVPSQESVED